MATARTASTPKRRDIPLGSVWKYSRTHFDPRYPGSHLSSERVEALIEVVTWAPGGVHLDFYLFYNNHHGGFDPPSKLTVDTCRLELSRLRPHEFWELVDKKVLKRINSPKRS